MIPMNKKDFVKEHKKLIKILMKGTKAEQVKEAQKQLKELTDKLKKA